MLVVLEGVDGSGKTTLMHKLKPYFDDNKIKTLTTKQPIYYRDQIFDPSINDKTRFYLLLADRSRHNEEMLIPSLNNVDIVFCDRNFFSTIVYQGEKFGVEKVLKELDWANRVDDVLLEPNLVILIDTPAEKAAERLALRGEKNVLDTEKISEIERRRFMYSEVLKAYGVPTLKYMNDGTLADLDDLAAKIAFDVMEVYNDFK